MNEKLNKHLAEKVMGWATSDCGTFYGIWIGSETFDETYTTEHWNPTENIEQSFMCLDTFKEGFEIFVEGDVKRVTVYFDEDSSCVYAREEANDSLSMAISLACAKATGYEDE